MRRLSSLITSLASFGATRIENLLADRGAPASWEPDDGARLIAARTVPPVAVRPYGRTNSAPVNVLYRSVATRDADVWAAVDDAAYRIDRIAELVAAVGSATVTSYGRSRARYDALCEAAARGTSVDELYVEMFTDTNGTDRLLTTASIEDGYLSLPMERIAVPAARTTVTASSGTTITSTDDGHSIVLDKAAANSVLTATIVWTPTSPTLVNEVVIPTGKGVVIERVTLVAANGTRTDIPVGKRCDIYESHVVTLPRTAVSSLEIALSQAHFETCHSHDNYHAYSHFTNHINKRLVRWTATLQERVAGRTDVRNMINHAAARVRRRRRPDTHHYLAIQTGSIVVRDTRYTLDGTWISNDLQLDGDLRQLVLTVAGEIPEKTNVVFSISVEGFPWIPVVPRNRREVASERLAVDYANTAALAYPAAADKPIAFTGIGDATVTTLHVDAADPTSPIHAVRFSKHVDEVTVSYTTAYSGIVSAAALGLATSSARVLDAATDGTLGERFVDASTGSVTLAHYPATTPEVYVRGVLAQALPDDTGFTDPTLDRRVLYYRLVGRTLAFSRPVSDVVVYYQYVQSSIRVRAQLTTTRSGDGVTPRLDAITIGTKAVRA